MTNILVVDDDQHFRDWMAAVLRNRGHEVVATSSVRFLVDRAQGILLPHTFGAAFIDMIMPEVDGIEMIRTLKSLNPTIRIVAMSAGGDSGDAEGYLLMAARFGAVGNLVKPFTAAKLCHTVEQVLGPR